MQLSFCVVKIVDNKLCFYKLCCTHKIQMKELFDQKKLWEQMSPLQQGEKRFRRTLLLYSFLPNSQPIPTGTGVKFCALIKKSRALGQFLKNLLWHRRYFLLLQTHPKIILLDFILVSYSGYFARKTQKYHKREKFRSEKYNDQIITKGNFSFSESCDKPLWHRSCTAWWLLFLHCFEK